MQSSTENCADVPTMVFVHHPPSQDMPESTKNEFHPILEAGQIFLSKWFASPPADGTNVLQEPSFYTKVYHIVALVKDQDGKVIDLLVEELHFRPRTSEEKLPGFRIFGENVAKYNAAPVNAMIEGLKSFNKDVLNSGAVAGKGLVFNKINTTVSDLVSALFADKCPEGCNKGWLPNQQALLDFQCGIDLKGLQAFTPLCPVCYGWRIVKQQIEIRRMIKRGVEVEPHLWEPFREAVCDRRWFLRYEDMCSCEFCLMPLGGHVHQENHEDVMQSFASAMQQEMYGGAVPRPAAQKALDGLPRKEFGKTVAKMRDQDQCPVCLDPLKDAKIVLELPCLHVMCPDQCMECFSLDHKCPICRGSLLSAADSGDAPETRQDEPAQRSLLDQYSFYRQPAVERNLSLWTDEPRFDGPESDYVRLDPPRIANDEEGRQWLVQGYSPRSMVNGMVRVHLERPYDDDEEGDEDDDDDVSDGGSYRSRRMSGLSDHGGPLGAPPGFDDGIEGRHANNVREPRQRPSTEGDQTAVPSSGWGNSADTFSDPNNIGEWPSERDATGGDQSIVPREVRSDGKECWTDSKDDWRDSEETCEDAKVCWGEVTDALGQSASEAAACDDAEADLIVSMESVRL